MSEAERLTALRSYAILDQPVEKTFGDFVDLASMICDAPIAIVSFIDAGRQWFAAELGLGFRETPTEQSICAFALEVGGTFEILDLSRDVKFSDNPMVVGGPGLRYYCGAPIVTSKGIPLGMVCVLDTVPRERGVSDQQKAALNALARQVMAHLDLRRTLAQRDVAIAEKDLLVREVHERVHSGLGTVQKLLQIQAREARDEETVWQFLQAAGRIQAFTAMHDRLYGVDGVGIELSAYLRDIVREQRQLQLSLPGERPILFEGAPQLWRASDAPMIGLILLEMLSNALKHGQGIVKVTLDRGDDEAVLSVEDKGAGLPAEFDPDSNAGFGLKMIRRLLASQRRGWIDLDRTTEHTRFVVHVRPIRPR